jgi:hypothetical protein
MMATTQVRRLRVHTTSAMYLMAAVALLAVGGSQALAATLATTNLAFNDGNGPDGGIWRGSVTVDVDPVSPGTIDDEVEATVEYAVFPPGRFQQYLDDNGLGGTDPDPLNAIYAYQITSVTAAVPGLSGLSVGFDVGDTANDVTFVATGVAGEVSPTTSANNITSAFWSFGTPLEPGDLSSILAIVSPSEPELDTMQLQSGLASPNPSPLVASITDNAGTFTEIPEPASAVLVAGLLAGCWAARYRRA